MKLINKSELLHEQQHSEAKNSEIQPLKKENSLKAPESALQDLLFDSSKENNSQSEELEDLEKMIEDNASNDFQPLPEDASHEPRKPHLKPVSPPVSSPAENTKEFLQINKEAPKTFEKHPNNISLNANSTNSPNNESSLSDKFSLKTLTQFLTFTEMSRKMSEFEQVYKSYFSAFYNHIESRTELKTISIFVVVIISLVVALFIKGREKN